MPAAPRSHACSFCGFDIAEVDLLFRSEIGGMPAHICSDCVELYAEVVRSHRLNPKNTASLIAAFNTLVEQRRQEMREATRRARTGIVGPSFDIARQEQ